MRKIFLFLFIAAFALVDSSIIFAQASFNTGKIAVNATNGGRIRILSGDNTTRQFDRISAMVSGNPGEVFDYSNDADAEVNAALLDNPAHSDFEIFSVLNNKYPSTPVPPDVLVKQNIYGWTNEEFLIIKFNVINREASAINARIGLDMIPQVNGTYDGDVISYNTSTQVLTIYDNVIVGVKFLSRAPSSVEYEEWYSGYSVDADLYNWMNSGNFDTAPFGPVDDDGLIAFMSTDAVNLAPGDSTELYFAVALGADENALANNLSAAAAKYLQVVPVELTSFTAASINGKVELKWNTATEVNNRGFEIERKAAGSDWVTVGFKEGKGTTTESQSYSFTDDVASYSASKLTYRLKQIDFDGTFSYSNEVEVNLVPSEFSLEQNYPNPFNPSTKITFNLAQKEMVSLKIFNSLGQEIASLINSELEAGQHNINFNAVNLSSGVYYYQLNAGTFSDVRKMILSK